MTWGKAAPALVIGAVFDTLRFMSTFLIFFGPAMTAALCALKYGAAVGILCGAGASALSVVGSEIFIPFGMISAMALGLAGWLLVFGYLIFFQSRLLKDNMLGFGISLLFSEIPFIDALPMLTGTLIRLYHTQIKKDKAALRAFKEREAEERKREQALYMRIAQARLRQQMEEERDGEEQERDTEMPPTRPHIHPEPEYATS